MVNETFPSMRLIALKRRKSSSREAAVIEREDGVGDAC
jgi:hypothetical protein